MSGRQSQTQAALIARVAMAESEDTPLGLRDLLARAEALPEKSEFSQTKPECLRHSAFEQLEEVHRWALLIHALDLFFTPTGLRFDRETTAAIRAVVEEAEEALDAKRTREDDFREEEEAEEMRRVEPYDDDEY